MALYGRTSQANPNIKAIWETDILASLHIQKVYTHTGTSSPQSLMLSVHAYM